MIDISKYFNPYERKARVYPALLVILPLAIAISIKIPELYSSLTGFVALFAGFGGLHLLAQIGRDAGKKLEPKLYSLWGGIPSVTIFRYRDSTIPLPAKQSIHKKLALSTKTNCPTPEDEIKDPQVVDEIYRTWSDFLRNKARDTKEFNLLFKENINFGFRRNVLGLKPAYCLVGILSMLILGLPLDVTSEIELSVMFLIALYTLFFVLLVNEAWVKVPGVEYAKRLVEGDTQS